MYLGKEIRFNDFSGGMVSNRPITELEFNEAATLDNLIVFPKGRGFRSRLGDTEFNSSAMASGAAVHGIGYYKQADQDEWLMAVCGTGIFKSEFDGTMDTITGAVSVTTGQDNIWTFVTFNDVVMGFGGPPTAPDAPFSWAGSGNAAALGGTPPSAYGAFQANNRVFAFRTAADRSKIYWSVLGNQADWTGTGSGSSDVWEADNDQLTAAAVLNTNTVLLFKENSVHQMQIGNLVGGAFPIFPLFQGIGCVGKHACVVADGLVYFITLHGKMKVTDGSRIFDEKDIPKLSDMDDQWAGLNTSRLQYIQGIRHTGSDFDHIKWIVSSGSSQTTNNKCFTWDLLNKCWLQNTTGFDSNVLMRTQAGVLYAGHYNGKIYKKEVAATYTDASEDSTVISANWTSGWIHNEKFETIKQPRKMNISFDTFANGDIRIEYGFDFFGFLQSPTIDQSTAGAFFDSGDLFDNGELFGGLGFNMKSIRLVGRGNFFQYKISSPILAYPFKIHGFTLSGKESGQKEISAR